MTRSFLSVLLGLLFLTTGACSKRHSVDTRPLKSSFEVADPTLRAEADKIVTAIKAGNLPEALTRSQALARRAKLTADQQQAISHTVAQLQKQLQSPPAPLAGKSPNPVIPSRR